MSSSVAPFSNSCLNSAVMPAQFVVAQRLHLVFEGVDLLHNWSYRLQIFSVGVTEYFGD